MTKYLHGLTDFAPEPTVESPAYVLLADRCFAYSCGIAKR